MAFFVIVWHKLPYHQPGLIQRKRRVHKRFIAARAGSFRSPTRRVREIRIGQRSRPRGIALIRIIRTGEDGAIRQFSPGHRPRVQRLIYRQRKERAGQREITSPARNRKATKSRIHRGPALRSLFVLPIQQQAPDEFCDYQKVKGSR